MSGEKEFATLFCGMRAVMGRSSNRFIWQTNEPDMTRERMERGSYDSNDMDCCGVRQGLGSLALALALTHIPSRGCARRGHSTQYTVHSTDCNDGSRLDRRLIPAKLWERSHDRWRGETGILCEV